MRAMSERRLIRLFPLPNVVLLPETTLPLHVFEPRYRRMLADALDSDRLIGMQLLKPEESGDERRPALHSIGCAGEVVHHEPLEDGRSNIVLRGSFRYRIDVETATDAPYRLAEVTPIEIAPLPPADGAGRTPRDLRKHLVDGVRRLADGVGRAAARELPARLSDEGLVNEAIARLGLEAEEAYELLAMNRLEERYAWTLAHIEGVQRRLDFLSPFRRPDGDPRWN
jgi:Lon protease-like protein